MFKIYINEEEVVSSKDYTIQQEMLNTPSVILNNVYPKTWENDKDYTTNFYHPEDYSKCKIVDEEYYPELPGSTADGTSFEIDVDTSKLYDLTLMRGDTTQTTTTTGKNLAKVSSGNNVIITDTIPAGTYRFSFDYVASVGYNLKLDSSSGSTIAQGSTSTGSGRSGVSFTLSSPAKIYLNGYVISGTGGFADNTSKYQIESGSTATDYEPYIPNSPSPDYPQAVNTVTGRQDIQSCGKNVLPYLITTQTKNNITLTNNGDGTYTLNTNGSASANTEFVANIPGELNGTYSLSINNATVNSNVSFRLRNSSNSDLAVVTANVANRTLENRSIVNGTKQVIRVASGTTLTNYVLKPQIEKGTTATSFEAYQGGIYEINLGKNLFDEETAKTKGTSSASVALMTIQLAPNATYTFSRYVNTTFAKDNGYYLYFATGENTSTHIFDLMYSTMTNPIQSGSATITTGASGIVKLMGTYATNARIQTYFQNVNVQIEKGSISSSYSAYKTPIELCKINTSQDFICKGSGKNLFSDTLMQGTTIYNTGEYVSSNTRITCTDWITLPAGTYTISMLSTNLSKTPNISNVTFDLDGTFYDITGVSGQWKTIPCTFTTPIDIKWKCNIKYTDDSNITPTGVTNVQIEEKQYPTIYEPYGFKDKWYLYKTVNKIVLDGTETTINSISNNRFQIGITDNSSDGYSTAILKSNMFRPISQSAIASTTEDNVAAVNGSYLYIRKTDVSTVSDFRTFLGNNKPSIYYILATPIATEITDTTLINQLNSLVLLNGVNNITVTSGDIPGVIVIHYNYQHEEVRQDILFCGVVENSGNISLNPRYPHYATLQILDYKTFLSEGELDAFVIADKTVLQAIQMVIDNISGYGFVLGNVNILNQDDMIGAYSTKDKSAYDVFNYIADITQSRWTTRTTAEGVVAIDFYDPTLMPQGTAINYNTSWFENNLIDDISYNYGSRDYRNKQVMTSNEVFGDIAQTQTMVSNGYTTSFVVEQQIGIVQTIKVNGVPKTVATNTEKTLGLSADFYYTVGKNIIESANTIAVNSTIEVQYTPIVKGRQVITNNNEITRVANSTGVKGVISRYENRNDATTSMELQKIGESYIKYKGSSEIVLTVQARKNMWNVGDRVQFNAPINELTKEYMVKKKTISRVLSLPNNDDIIFYTFELSSSFNSESAINYFDNQRAKANGNIGEGDYISRNVDIEEEGTIIFYDTQISLNN